MSNGYQSELELENSFVKQLQDQAWERVVFEDYSELEDNFRRQLVKLNRRTFTSDNPLTDAEYARIMADIKNRGVFKSAQLLREDSHLLVRDDNTTVHYCLFNKKEWCKNIFQVAQQVKMDGTKWHNRYDVTLLINGLPLIQVELKRRGVDLASAFNQVVRYKRDNAYHGLFNFIQFFIISNGVRTRYFANSESNLSYSFAFKWTDTENKEYVSLQDFASTFLDKCWASKMIARYMVVQETTRKIIVMRPYQVHGTERMVHRAMETGNNGYLWHTTGSGKTLTSFKVARIIAGLGKFGKIVFMVDRKDLNKQVMDEFNLFQPGSITNSESTRKLVENLASTKKDDQLVLTTIQKFDKALKDKRNNPIFGNLKDKPILFIIDECHRSQFGEMQKTIRAKFPKSQYLGFTGTPILPENKSADNRTTADLFDECLHTYLLIDGINDRNTLPLSIEYVSTLFVKEEIEGGDTEIERIESAEVLNHPTRIKNIVNDILADRKLKSKNGKFNAMFTVDSVRSAILYMDAFKTASKTLPEAQRPTIATVYSFTPNELLGEHEEYAKDALGRYIEDYNATFDTNYDMNDISRYNTNVGERFKANQIDILVVVNMMLTGFDSPILNTLYVDKKLKHHSLIQAYSRTNRVLDSTKPAGHIRCYRSLKKSTDEALRIFSKVDNVNTLLALPFSEQKEKYEQAVAKLMALAPSPTDALSLKSETDKKEYVLAFRDVARELRRIETFSEFNHKDYAINKQDIEDYRSHYLDIREETIASNDATSILNDIDFRIEEVMVDTINVDYIYNLLASTKSNDNAGIKKIRDLVERSGTSKLRKKRVLILEFLDDVVPQLNEDDNLYESYLEYVDVKNMERLQENSEKFGISTATLIQILATSRFRNRVEVDLFFTETSLGFPQNIIAGQELKEFVAELMETYETTE